MLRVLDLFSGIGGFSLGLERTGGFETVAFCEIEEFPRKVLEKHWPGVPIHRDVRELRGEDVGPVDLICGGYPCQPFSTAGQRRGAEDDRHLWPEFNRLVAELRPSWVIGENVAGHISMGLDEVLSDLEGQGYACRAFVIPACAVGAPHQRFRVWTVAHCDDAGQRANTRAGSDDWDASRHDAGRVCWDVPDPKLPVVCASGGKVGRNGGQREPFSGVGVWAITREPGICRGNDGVPNRLDRLKALGNAVVPQIPELIGRAILAAEANP